MVERVSGFQYGEVGDDGLNRIRDALWMALEATIVVRDCWEIILSYVIFKLQVGRLYDVRGGGANLNMFYPASDRWDVCRLLRITHQSGDQFFEFEPVDRVHPYAYLFPHTEVRHTCTILKKHLEGRVAPYLSRVTRRLPAEAKEYDLIDYGAPLEGGYGAPLEGGCGAPLEGGCDVNVYEVAANIGSSLWILPVMRYTSQEVKESVRLWVDIHDPRLQLYRSAPIPQIPSHLTSQDQLVGYKYLLHQDSNSQKWTHILDSSSTSS